MDAESRQRLQVFDHMLSRVSACDGMSEERNTMWAGIVYRGRMRLDERGRDPDFLVHIRSLFAGCKILTAPADKIAGIPHRFRNWLGR